ncbi:ATP-binding protein [Geitlerinema sp. PCC 9228]|uniref:ATP-binding protein n=1 Tax=Geitlerinema sp. PCC 9228 TaxID=111611 RepID=UPI001114C55F|nr:ATP-binding protein [Geitlerinema sp. PCC 9228]
MPMHIHPEHEKSLQDIAWTIEMSQGKFSLTIARCNSPNLRDRLIRRLQDTCQVPIHNIPLPPMTQQLYGTIRSVLADETPAAAMVYGFERVRHLDRAIVSVNPVREEFRKYCPFPIVFWLSDRAMRLFLRLVPDFESWSTLTRFPLVREDWQTLLQTKAARFYVDALQLDWGDRATLLDELEAGQSFLQQNGSGKSRDLAANVKALQGFVSEENEDWQTAIEHYWQAIQLWQQQEQWEIQQTAKIDPYLTKIQGKIWEHMAFCSYAKSQTSYSPKSEQDTTIHHALLAFLEDVKTNKKRPDILADGLVAWGRWLRYWHCDHLLAEISHFVGHWYGQKRGKETAIVKAKIWGYLAEVAALQKNWSAKEDYAKRAIDLIAERAEIYTEPAFANSEETGDDFPLLAIKQPEAAFFDWGRYHFLLGKACWQQGKLETALEKLQIAKQHLRPEYDLLQYLEFLDTLRFVYWQRKQYLAAYTIKQEQRSVKQAYGLQAFVGAAPLQPRMWQPMVEATALEIPQGETETGRQRDIQNLLERIKNPRFQMIVVHGSSGVGKSSLLRSALVPTLQETSVETDDLVPIVLQSYNYWLVDIGKQLQKALAAKRRIHISAEMSMDGLQKQLAKNRDRHLRVVLIFDQFEEFFLACTQSQSRREFFTFVASCLQMGSEVKVILSLREDFLHHLLRYDNLPGMEAIENDILSKKVRYPIGNFSQSDAYWFIQKLTQRANFFLEPALVKQLVADLADEEGEVRPIELQVVGAQLQTEQITTLEAYQKAGTKEELVERYLQDVVQDCGEENQRTAKLLLYWLTEPSEIRPQKTRLELEQDFRNLGEEFLPTREQLNLVLEILVASGLVSLIPEIPRDRYQLIHDYLVTFIRNQQEAPELEKEREERQRLQKTLQEVRQDLAAAKAERDRLYREIEIAKERLRDR